MGGNASRACRGLNGVVAFIESLRRHTSVFDPAAAEWRQHNRTSARRRVLHDAGRDRAMREIILMGAVVAAVIAVGAAMASARQLSDGVISRAAGSVDGLPVGPMWDPNPERSRAIAAKMAMDGPKALADGACGQ